MNSPRRPSFTRTPTTPTNPDRFIPTRAADLQTARESFLLSKSPDRLSPPEKLARNNGFGPDPFSNSIPTPPRTPRASRDPALAINNLRRGTLTSGPRQISNGAVWNVGGAAALGDSVTGVSNGRGGMLASGTNAPLYTSNFLSRTESSAEVEMYERRLAAALELDVSARTFHFTGRNTTSTTSPCSDLNSSPTTSLARMWQDGTWIKPGDTTGNVS
jgi:hypothetical protein